MLVAEGAFHDRLESLRKYVLDQRRYDVKVYAKGCDAPGCTKEAEVDKNLGRPVGWYFVNLDGGDPLFKRTLVVCSTCLAPAIAMLVAPAKP